jgi:hypothetical protein
MGLSAQARHAVGAREVLECWFDRRPIRDEYLIVHGGKLAGTDAHSYSAGVCTGGSDEAARSVANRARRRTYLQYGWEDGERQAEPITFVR